jgi:DNA-binding MarR family transcriptional regulator
MSASTSGAESVASTSVASSVVASSAVASTAAPTRRASAPVPSSREISELLHRKALASYRHRTMVSRRLGMTESEITALSYLAHARLTPGQLGELLNLTSGGVTALLRRLEAAGHVRREPHPTDRRSVILCASADALAGIRELYAPMAEDIDRVTSRLAEGEREIVARYLSAVAEAGERRADELAGTALT